MKELRIIVASGTIDKVHDPKTEGLGFAQDGSTHIPEMLQIGRCHFPVVHRALLKDSLNFDDGDREIIAAAVSMAPEVAVVVTHGTGTMGETARFLAERISGKTLVRTGAMRPFSLFSSDAEFNLGGAVIAAQLLPHGVYGVMNGRVFPAEKVHKNTEHGRFDR